MMDRNNPINMVYVMALGVASLVACVNSFYTALIFAVAVISSFLIGVCVVSMIEKIADKHVKFLTFALVAAAVITILKVVSGYITSILIVNTSKVIDFAIIPCLLLAIVPIYFEESFSAKQYFINSLITSFGFLLMLVIFGCVTEIAGFGLIAGKSLGFAGFEFFAMSYGKFIVIGLISILFNIVRRAYLKKMRRFNMLVERYKIQIREIKSSAKRAEMANKKEEK